MRYQDHQNLISADDSIAPIIISMQKEEEYENKETKEFY